MVQPDSHGVSRVVHHKDFYLRGGDMTVMVENHLYRIHSYFFERESLFFRQKLNANRDGDNEQRGSSDNNAYTLEDVKSEDFARFLWVFYNPKYSVYEAPLETWLSILVLANRWTFDNVKELAVRELEKIEIEPVEKIAIYHDNNISRLYLVPSYVAICKRDKPLTFTEGMKLGMETVLRIADARERVRLQASESGIRTPTFEDFEDSEVEVLIREVFCLGARPTSPTPATASPSGTTATTNGTIKLNPAPPGNPPKANGVHALRANGGSAADTKRAGVDGIPSINAVLASQAPATQPTQPSTATPERPVPTSQATLAAAQAATSTATPPPPPPPADKPKDSKETAPQQSSNVPSVISPKSGAGEPSSSEVAKDSGQTSASDTSDVSITKPVVASTEHSTDVTADPNENEKEKENDADSIKDNDLMSPIGSDTEGGKGGKRGGKNKRGGASGLLGAVRGGKKP